jgi:hypothetical protein
MRVFVHGVEIRRAPERERVERSRDLFTSKMFFVFLRTRKSWKRIETSKKKKKKKVGIALLVIERSALRGKNQTTNKNQKLCCCWEKEKEEIQENRTIVFFLRLVCRLVRFYFGKFFCFSLSANAVMRHAPLCKKKKKKIPSVYIALAHNRWLRLFSVCCNATKLH